MPRSRVLAACILAALATGAFSQDATTAAAAEYTKGGLLSFLLAAAGAALLALLTPCVFPMIPVTVSYFAKQGETNPHLKIKGPIAYCLGIISTFTVVGLSVSLLFGVSGITNFAAHPWTNFALGVLFVALALSLFGVYEFKMPGGLVNKANEGRKKGGLIAPFAMGLTFALTSFTCTVAFVATLLGLASKGSLLTPALGLLVFGTIFALPFFFLALFPSGLAKLPKSGSWMVTLKGFMGFLEIIAALKFFQNADLQWKLGLLTRDTFLTLWVTLFVLSALYLMGWQIIPGHEAKVGWLRRIFGLATFGVAFFFLTGIGGKSLGFYEGFMPPKDYGRPAVVGSKKEIGELEWITNDIPKAQKLAKEQGKQIFIDFTGYSCVNCRRMEADIFPKPTVKEAMSQYVLLRLYTDDIVNNPEQSEAYQELQTKLVGAISLPYYVIVDPEIKPLFAHKDWEPDVAKFTAFLNRDEEFKVRAH